MHRHAPNGTVGHDAVTIRHLRDTLALLHQSIPATAGPESIQIKGSSLSSVRSPRSLMTQAAPLASLRRVLTARHGFLGRTRRPTWCSCIGVPVQPVVEQACDLTFPPPHANHVVDTDPSTYLPLLLVCSPAPALGNLHRVPVEPPAWIVGRKDSLDLPSPRARRRSSGCYTDTLGTYGIAWPSSSYLSDPSDLSPFYLVVFLLRGRSPPPSPAPYRSFRYFYCPSLIHFASSDLSTGCNFLRDCPHTWHR